MTMHLFYLFITTLFVLQIETNEYKSQLIWNRFKTVHKKQYVNYEEEKYR